ncbi:MAG: mechanosensitive ion channel [Ilumatobacter sp.]|jgi:hypothetical protein|nr:mechanosensitive ion channel [Ilumatobacter sp.]
MIDPWIFATGAIVVGLLSGVIGAALVRRIILTDRSDYPEVHDAARASSMFLFLFFASMGVIVAIGFINPETLEPIPAEILRESPRVLAAGLILIAARALAFAVGGLVNGAFEGSGARMRSQIASLGRMLVYSVAIVLALSQLGVETTILSIIVGGVVFAGGLAFALLVGLGGRELGGELAAGRYLHRLVRVGDEIEVGGTAGRIVALHPASVELAVEDGSSVHLANSLLTKGEMRVRHQR